MLQTSRLLIRRFCASDVETLFEYRNDSRCSRYQRYGDTSKACLERFVRDYSDCDFLSTQVEQHYAIVCIENGCMIGDLSVFYTEKDNCFTLGITIAPAFQRKGYAYELLSGVVTQIRQRYPSVEIVALIEKGNDASISSFQKLGFAEECYAQSIQSYVYTIAARQG